VENYDEGKVTGTGFTFGDLTAGALFDTVGWAVHTWYHRQDALRKLIANAMAQRFTWEEAARRYDEVYRRAVRIRRGR
jgi:starch synthase